MQFHFQFSESLKKVLPDFRIGVIETEICNSEKSPELWKLINRQCQLYQGLEPKSIRKIAPLSDAVNAYKQLGIDPSRYRLSAENLIRRIVKGQALYQINTAVDIINYLSLESGFSIGAFDLNSIDGTQLLLRKGVQDEEYYAIGRGKFNIHRIPLISDQTGAFGNPSSDSDRTKIQLASDQLLIVIYDFMAHPQLNQLMEKATGLLSEFLQASNLKSEIIFQNNA